MSWFKKLLKSIAPIAGSALGSFAGGELGFGSSLGGALGGALGGGLANIGGGIGDILGQAATGGLEGYFAGPAIDSALGYTPGAGSPSFNLASPTGGGGLSSALGTGLGGSPAGATDGLNLDPNNNFLNSVTGGANVPGVTDALGAASGAIAPAAQAAAGAGGAAGSGSLGGLTSFFEKNPAFLMAAVGGLGSLGGNQQTPAEKALTKQAKAANAASQGLVTAASTGQLPAGAQAAWQSALDDTLTSIKSKYANLGLSGSTMESQELSAAKERAAGLKYQMATEATQTGLQALNLSSNLYNQLMQLQLQNDNSLSSAIGNFAGAMGGGQGAVA